MDGLNNNKKNKEIKIIREKCLKCIKEPCKEKGCPLSNEIKSFINEEDMEKAFKILTKTTVLPAICARVCPHYEQCMGACTRRLMDGAVDIPIIEAEIGDYANDNNLYLEKNNIKNKELKNKKVAIIGSGPSGLTATAFLAMNNIGCTLYEKNAKLGGLLSYGIPDFRLDRKIIEKTIKKILDLGVKVELNKELGRNLFIEDLLKNYDAVYIATGSNVTNRVLESEKEEYKNQRILPGNQFLEYVNKLKYNEKILKTDEMYDFHKNNNINNYKDLEKLFTSKKVAVNGGGNVAMDVARTLVRLNSKVKIIYRRSKDEMPATEKEINDVEKENVKIDYLRNILAFDTKNKELELIKTILEKVDNSRPRPVNIENSNYKETIDYLILATGSKTDKLILNELNIKNSNYITVNKNIDEENKENKKHKEYKYQLNDNNSSEKYKKIFAGGDIIGSKQTVATAAKDGREAAYEIIEYLKESNSK